MAWSAAHDDLLKKVDQEMDEYNRSMWDLPGHAVISKADEIAARRFCYNQLMGHLSDYPSEKVEWLLQYEKPLETVYSRWMVEQDIDLEAEFDRVLQEWGYEEPESGMDVPGMS